MGASINAALRQQEKQYNRPAGEEMYPPFGGCATTFPPRGAVGLWVLSHGAMSLQESIETYSAP